MSKRILVILLVMVIIVLSVACKQDKEINLLPPEKDKEVKYKTSNLIYQNDESTVYSIGGVDSIFTFSNDMLSINDNGEVKTYETSYNKTTLTIEDFKKQLQGGDEIPEISSYKNITQYDLCSSTNDLPGYRLYVLDGQYWIGTLYKNSIWRIVSVEIDK